MKKLVALFLALTCVLGLAGCSNRSMNYIIANEPSITGVVKETNVGSILIENENGEYWVSLNVENKDSMTHFSIGDEVVVYYDGNIAESYPMQINTVYAITLLTPANRTETEETEKAAEKDEDAVLSLVTDFINLKVEDFQSETHLSMEGYFVPELRDSLETQTFWKVFRFEKLIRMQQSLLWETFDLEIQEIRIQGSTATVVAFESYEYQLEKSNGMSSGRGTTLFFTCEKVGDEWLIRSIDTDNELIEGHVSGYSAEELPALAGYSE